MSALSHIRILELGQVIAGTWADMILADLGAEVIKIEPPRGDLGRNPHIAYMKGESALFITMNRNKKSICVDLKQPAGLEAFYDLVRKSDVVLDNFRPGVLERMRADYETLSKINPRIVCGTVTGFGPRGPYKDLPSFDLIHQSITGHLSVTGHPGGPPARLGLPLADLASGFFLTHGVLAALLAREHTGRGQRVETSMFEVMLFLLTYDATMYLNTGEIAGPQGSGHLYHVPWQAFKTSDNWVVVATREEVFWQNFCRAIGAPELADDERYRTNLDRLEHRDELVALLETYLVRQTTAEWLEVFSREQVPSAPVNNIAQALADPTVAELGGIVDAGAYGSAGPIRMLANPLHFSATPVEHYNPPPQLGQDTRDVLADVAGYDAAKIAELEAQSVVKTGLSTAGVH
ncbi:MAG: CoA transferase [Chloroflexi bacterium]|nr:CoA transferase [Chloroflexota bacterium]